VTSDAKEDSANDAMASTDSTTSDSMASPDSTPADSTSSADACAGWAPCC
jgi:hypothetical protein